MSEQIFEAILLTWDFFHNGFYRFNHKGKQVFIKKRKYGQTDITHMQIEVGRMKFTLNTAGISYETFMQYIDQIVKIEQGTSE